MKRTLVCLLAAVLLAVVMAVCWPQQIAMPPAVDANTIDVKVVLGAHVVITAEASRVHLTTDEHGISTITIDTQIKPKR